VVTLTQACIVVLRSPCGRLAARVTAEIRQADAMSTTTIAPPSPRQRLISLDVYRGLIMVLLAFRGFGLAGIATKHLKQAPDSAFWPRVHYMFEHVDWVGGGLWDMIQPSFTFMVGVSMAYSYVNRQREGQSWRRMFGHACWRSLILILLGIFLNSATKGATDWASTNVLLIIGLGYPFLFLLWGRRPRTQLLAAAGVLLGTWMLYVGYPTKGIDLAAGAPDLGISPAWAQQHLAGIGAAWHKNAGVGHAVQVWITNLFPQSVPYTHNPGGYTKLIFVPTLATMIFGLMCGELLRSDRAGREKLRLMLIAGAVGLAAGLVWHWLGCPLIKRIWTPSWALYSTGWCVLILAGLYGVIDLLGWRRGWTFPFVVVGMNSIAIYCMDQLLPAWVAQMFQLHLGKGVFGVFGPMNEPLLRSVSVGLVFWLVCLWMYRRKIFLRI
jgi:heparan-alpha-glucosaminide N-acetyltransferase